MIRNNTQFRTEGEVLEFERYPSRRLRDEIRRVEAVAFEYLLLRLFACISLPGVCQTAEIICRHSAGIERGREKAYWWWTRRRWQDISSAKGMDWVKTGERRTKDKSRYASEDGENRWMEKEREKHRGLQMPFASNDSERYFDQQASGILDADWVSPSAK